MLKTSLPAPSRGGRPLRFGLLLPAVLALLAACVRDPLVPSSGEFGFLETWGKDSYTTSREIGPGHGDGTAGSEVGAFNAPASLCLYQDELFVLDAGNRRIQKFSLSGAPRQFADQTAPGVHLNCLGSEGFGTNEFVEPSDLFVDASGRIFVADRENFCIQVFDSPGRIVRVIGRSLNSRPAATNAPGGFIRPVRVTADPSGRIYVLDTGKSTVDRFSNSLVPDTAWQSAGSLHRSDLASAADIEFSAGRLWVLLQTKILELDSAGNPVATVDRAGFSGDRLAAGRRLSACGDLFAVADGNYLKFFNPDWVFRFSMGGLTGDREGEMDLPSDAVLSGETLYTTDTANNRIQVFRR